MRSPWMPRAASPASVDTACLLPHLLHRLTARRVIFGLLLVFQAFFLNVILPAHTRGAFTLDGKHSTDGPSGCCCCGGAAAQPGHGPFTPSQRDKDNCALCQFMAGLSSAPVVTLTLPELGLLTLLPVPPPAVHVARDLQPTYFACGPPLFAARV